MQNERKFPILLSPRFLPNEESRKSLHKCRNGYAEIPYIMQTLYENKAKIINFIATDGMFCGNRLCVLGE